MKTAKLVLTVMLFVLIANTLNAENPDYFIGKWSVTVEGTPNGDATSTFVFERVDGKLTGYTQSEGQEPIKFSSVEEEGDEVTAYFTTSGYDVYLYVERIDDDTVEGSMMDMFDCTGKRVFE